MQINIYVHGPVGRIYMYAFLCMLSVEYNVKVALGLTRGERDGVHTHPCIDHRYI